MAVDLLIPRMCQIVECSVVVRRWVGGRNVSLGALKLSLVWLGCGLGDAVGWRVVCLDSVAVR